MPTYREEIAELISWIEIATGRELELYLLIRRKVHADEKWRRADGIDRVTFDTVKTAMENIEYAVGAHIDQWQLREPCDQEEWERRYLNEMGQIEADIQNSLN
jgi:hypothetical protein